MSVPLQDAGGDRGKVISIKGEFDPLQSPTSSWSSSPSPKSDAESKSTSPSPSPNRESASLSPSGSVPRDAMSSSLGLFHLMCRHGTVLMQQICDGE